MVKYKWSRMGTAKVFIFFMVFIIAVSASYSFQSDSSNYDLSTGVVSSGGDKIDSDNYNNYVTTGTTSGVVESSIYKNWLGFFYTWLLGDGQPCASASQCSGGYCCDDICSSNECPVAVAAASDGGGVGAAAGGGGGFFTQKGFSLNPGSVKIKLALGESAEEILTIKNTGTSAITIPLAVEGVRPYLSLSEEVIILEAGEDTEVSLNFIGRNIGGFAGQILAVVDEIKESIPVILEITTEKVLFDVKLDIPAAYSEIEPGDELKTQITLLNVGAPEKVDVFATYFIKDLRGNIVYEETETFAVEKQISYPKIFRIHETTEPGSYVAIIEVRYTDSFAVSSQFFRVVEEKSFVDVDMVIKNTTLMIFLTFILLTVISVLVYKLVSITRKGKKKKKEK
tara:strand:+ start:537 stop:1727 length:1191 start_codon:yes stop_codon:yes gene_type:complete